MTGRIPTPQLIDDCLRRLVQAQLQLLKAQETTEGAYQLHRLNDARTLIKWTFRDLDDKVTEIWGQIIYDLDQEEDV